MDYELAKKLKDAGFPQTIPTHSPAERYSADGISQHHWEHHTGDPLKEFNDPYAIKIPTLSELIEACGDRFGNLHKVSAEYWCAEESGGGSEVASGLSPEIATARLWLAFNEK